MATVPIFKTRDGEIEPFYVPTFRVEVGASPASMHLVYDVSRVSYKDSVNQIDSFDLTVNNADWSPNVIRYTGQAPGTVDPVQIMPGAYVRLWMGYETALGLFPMLTGRVTSIAPAFGDSGATVTVRALSSLEALRAKPKRRPWPEDRRRQSEITDSDIARAIGRENNVRVIIPRGLREAAEPQVTQANQTDIAFLIQRATRRGYIVCFRERLTTPPARSPRGPRRVGGTTEKVLYFGPSNLLRDQEALDLGERPERFELAWGKSLIDFRPTLNLSTNLWSKVTVSYWNRRNRTRPEVKYELRDLWNDELGLNSDLKPLLDMAALGENEVSGVPVHTEGEARDLARNTLRENFLGLVTAEGTTVGMPELRACSRVEVRGVGAPFDGRYFLTSTTHTIDDNGYRTQLSARREQLTEGA